ARLRPVRTRRRERSRPRRTTLRAGASRDPRHARAWPGRAQRRVAGLNADGVLVVDKPVGPTSHDIVAQARRWYGTRSVGHAGTLDPAASGVLVLMFGEAKKLSSYLTAQSKAYIADVCFGRATDSLDASGATIAEQPLPSDWPPADELAAALEAERSRTAQLPPVVSAIKLGGRPAHRRVRAGESVELAPRPVQVE